MKLMKISDIADEAQIENLKNKTVTIVGLGGVGSTLSQILVRNGVNLRIVDKERVYEQEIPRQTLYTMDDLKKFKAKQAKKRLEEISDKVKIKTFHEELIEDNTFLLKSDLIIDASNNPKTTKLINKYASDNNIRFVLVNYSGHKGHVVVIDSNKKSPQACYNCVKEKIKMKQISKTGIYSPLSSLMASLVANECFKELLGIGMTDKLLSVDALKPEIKHTTVKPDEDCEKE